MLRVIKQFHFNNIILPLVRIRVKNMSSIANGDNKKRPLDENQHDHHNEKMQRTDRIKKKNFALLMSYLGKDYFGMQRNPNMRTIEEDLISAMFKAKLIDEEAFDTIQHTRFQRAARTDKGVSAARQICSVKLPEHANIDHINEFLPKQIRVFGLKRVTKGFNSKSQCNARSYTYTLPTFAFAPDDPSIITKTPTEEDIEQRIKELSVIDGKPFTEFRMSPELLDKVNSTFKLFEGTHRFHNFTTKIRPLDPRAMRYMVKCECIGTHIANNMEFATILVKGQSFMFHQIRKMIALGIGVIRNLVPTEIINESFKPDKMEIPVAPSIGLVLNYVHYDNYNKRYGSDGIHEKLEWAECDEQVEKFNKEFILRHIEETEVNDKSYPFFHFLTAMKLIHGHLFDFLIIFISSLTFLSRMLLWIGDLARHTFSKRDDNCPEDDIDIDDNEKKEDSTIT